jgi:hypothetical protein
MPIVCRPTHTIVSQNSIASIMKLKVEKPQFNENLHSSTSRLPISRNESQCSVQLESLVSEFHRGSEIKSESTLRLEFDARYSLMHEDGLSLQKLRSLRARFLQVE